MNTLIFLTIIIAVVRGYEDSIQATGPGFQGVAGGDVMIQRITKGATHVNHIFYSTWKKTLYFVDKLTNTMYTREFKSVDAAPQYIPEIENERLAFAIPVRGGGDNKFIIGSDLNLRILTKKSKDEIEVSDPVLQFNETGYEISIAHCDKNGAMFVVLNFVLMYAGTSKMSMLYKIVNKEATLVESFDEKITDFEFSYDFDKMFVLTNNGLEITEYDYNAQKAEISNPKVKFSMIEHGTYARITSLDVDDKKTLWVTAGPYVLRISVESYKIMKVVRTPFSGLTRLTFGGLDGQHISVGTSKVCHKTEFQAGSVFVISGIPSRGHKDEEVAWGSINIMGITL